MEDSVNEEIEYSWLQISDLHIFDNTEWKIMKEAYRKLPDRDTVKFIIVTGDLHQYKDEAGYTKTADFLNLLLDSFSLSKRNLFMVPGNHDSQDCDSKEVYNFYIDEKIEADQDCYIKYFTKGKLIDCFENYHHFIKEFYGDLADDMYPEPEQVSVLNWNNRLNLIHLNTAINCNGDNTRKQIIDIYKMSNLIHQINRKLPSIIIAHHPIDTLFQSHYNALIRFITDWKVSAYLCGDLHKELLKMIGTYDKTGSCIPCIVCGKAAPDNQDSYSDLGCILYSKKKGCETVEVTPYEWDKRAKLFRKYPGLDCDNGRCEFTLLKCNIPQAVSAEEIRENQAESIWLPDAEAAHGRQTRFGTFTSTKIIEEFIRDESATWGLSAVKGIGKTFVLQIKRTKSTPNNICLPIGIKATPENNWGTDSIVLGNNIDLSALKNYNHIVSLWKYSLIIYVVNQLYHIRDNVAARWWGGSANPSEGLKIRLEELLRIGRIDKETFNFCTNPAFNNLNIIINYVILTKKWMNFVGNDLGSLIYLRKSIDEVLESLTKDAVLIFIDKIDQSLKQTNAEPPDNCEICRKRNYIMKCNDVNKSPEYCSQDSTSCQILCCYGCENFATTYSNTSLRIYNENSKKYRHINLWQHLQLGLLDAVYQIKEEYASKIRVYFTIRHEAFSSEDFLLGQHRKKTLKIINELWYTKEEQKKIFEDCIRNQDDNLLFDPCLKNDRDRLEEAFLGVDKLYHPYTTKLSESIFDIIYRHSFDRTRDIQEYGEMLTANLNKIRSCGTVLERGELIKSLIGVKAAELAFCDEGSIAAANGCYYLEKMNLLPNYWAQTENFKDLILRFDRNLLFSRQVVRICKQINGIKRCDGNCNRCSAKHHPFSMLYKLGMLGQIHLIFNGNEDIEQKFLHSKEITYLSEEDILNVNNRTIYILHPALTKSIESLKNKQIRHFKGFLLGKGNFVSRVKLEQLIEDKSKLKVKEFDDKYFFSS